MYFCAMPSLSLLETIAAIFGVLSVVLARFAHIGVFPTGLVSTLLYIYICWGAGLYADMGINVWYSLLSVYGWWRWLQPKTGFEDLAVSWSSGQLRRASVLVALAAWVVLYFVLRAFTDSTVPVADAFTTAVAIVGMYLMAEKKVENWLAWMVVDVVSIVLYASKGLYVSSLQFVVFTALAWWGWVSWQRLVKAA
jgi:nicotinamide mononucleotide transporter